MCLDTNVESHLPPASLPADDIHHPHDRTNVPDIAGAGIGRSQGAKITPDVPILRLPRFKLLAEMPKPIAAAALSPPPATTGNPAGSPTRAAISDFSLPAIAVDLTTEGNKAGLILRALRISVSYCRLAKFKRPRKSTAIAYTPPVPRSKPITISANRPLPNSES